MKKHLLSSIATVVVPFGLYGAPQISFGSYSRPFQKHTSVGNKMFDSSAEDLILKRPGALGKQSQQMALNNSEDIVRVKGTKNSDSSMAIGANNHDKNVDLILQPQRKEILIIDENVPDKQAFIMDLPAGVDVFQISANQNGLEQLKAIF